MDKITQEEIEQLKQRNAELEAQLVEVNNNRTGVAPCARFCEALAAKKMFDNLQRENAELMAQVQLLRDNLKSVLVRYDNGTGCIDTDGIELGNAFRFDDGEFNGLCRIVEMTPAQCLAEHDREVAARAVEKAINLCQHSFGSWENAITGSLGVADYELQEYANKIKSGEVQL